MTAGKPRPVIDWEAPKTLEQVEELAALGLTHDQIAYRLGVTRQTVSENKRLHPAFADAIKRGQTRGIEEVASALRNKVKEGDTGAIIYYLKSRAGWSDKVTEEQLKQANEKTAILLELCKAILSNPAEEMAQAKALVSMHLDQILLQAGKLTEDEARSLHGQQNAGE